jgi:beta-mannosidase
MRKGIRDGRKLSKCDDDAPGSLVSPTAHIACVLARDDITVMSSVPLKWLVGHHKSRDERPEQWAEARVPGAVQLDWAQAQGWGPHYVGDAFRQYEWMEDVYWTYTAKFPTVDLKPSERLVFHCGGVDYACDVLLNGALLHRQEGMLTPIDLDLTEAAGRGGELAIRIDPAPKSAARPSRDQANRSCKPAVSYGWDFHPRLIPLGIWQETALTVRPAGYIRSAELTYTLSKGLDRADLGLAVSFAGGDDGRVR